MKKDESFSPITGRHITTDYKSRSITITPADGTPQIDTISRLFLHYKEVELILGISKWMRYRLQKRNKLKPVAYSRATWYRKEEVEALIKKRFF